MSEVIYLSDLCLTNSSERHSFMMKQLSDLNSNISEAAVFFRPHYLKVSLKYKECRSNLHLGENRNVFAPHLVLHCSFVSLSHMILVGESNYTRTLSIMLVSSLSKLSAGFN